MKKITFNPVKKIEVVHANTVPPQSIIGFVCDGDKGWLQPTSYMGDSCKPVAARNGVRHGNGWPGGTYHACFQWLRNVEEVFVFDNEKELFNWLFE
jgi:hypothetical protein